jgi:hypothetical protein
MWLKATRIASANAIRGQTGAAYLLGSAWLFLTTAGQGTDTPMRWLLRWFDTLVGDAVALGRRVAVRWGVGG